MARLHRFILAGFLLAAVPGPAAAQAPEAQAPLRLQGRTLTGFGVMMAGTGEARLPMANFFAANMAGPVALPAFDVGLLWLPMLNVVGTADLGVGPLLQLPDGSAALSLRAGPSGAFAFLAEEGMGAVPGAHVSADLMVRAGPSSMVRIGLTRRRYRDADGSLAGVWAVSFGVVSARPVVRDGLQRAAVSRALAPDSQPKPRLPRTHWAEGGAVGATVGLLGVGAYATAMCEGQSNCTLAVMESVLFGGAMGFTVGALVGGLIPKAPPAP